MDARLDSSLATYPGAGTAKFDVFTLLSAEEVCWVMDKTICAEVCSECSLGHCCLTAMLVDGVAPRSFAVPDNLYLSLLF